MARHSAQRRIDHSDTPVAWFVALEFARNQGDRESMRRALIRLRQLGVRVEIGDPLSEPARAGHETILR